MKNTLNFNIQFSNLWTHESFPNCLAGVHTFLEGQGSDTTKYCNPDDENKKVCFGCGCKTGDPTSIYFCLFDTMCGRSAVRIRFDGTLTKMAEMIGDVKDWSGKCATDYTTDFLFGFVGYDYSKITDPTIFKTEITASIDLGKPIIAESAVDNEGFRVITGYDGDTAICSHYAVDQKENKREKKTATFAFDEFKALYIICNKITPRYTLKDGLERIKLVMKNNIEEGIWDKGIEEITRVFVSSTDDEYQNMNPEEIKVLRKRFADTVVNRFNNHTFNVSFFNCDQFGLRDPVLIDLWNKIDHYCSRIYNYDHKVGRFNGVDVSDLGLFRAGYGRMLLSAIEDINGIYVEMLDIVDQAIRILNKK